MSTALQFSLAVLIMSTVRGMPQSSPHEEAQCTLHTGVTPYFHSVRSDAVS